MVSIINLVVIFYSAIFFFLLPFAVAKYISREGTAVASGNRTLLQMETQSKQLFDYV